MEEAPQINGNDAIPSHKEKSRGGYVSLRYASSFKNLLADLRGVCLCETYLNPCGDKYHLCEDQLLPCGYHSHLVAKHFHSSGDHIHLCENSFHPCGDKSNCFKSHGNIIHSLKEDSHGNSNPQFHFYICLHFSRPPSNTRQVCLQSPQLLRLAPHMQSPPVPPQSIELSHSKIFFFEIILKSSTFATIIKTQSIQNFTVSVHKYCLTSLNLFHLIKRFILDPTKMHKIKRKNSSVYGDLSITQDKKTAKQSDSLLYETADSDDMASVIGKLSIEHDPDDDEEISLEEKDPSDENVSRDSCLTWEQVDKLLSADLSVEMVRPLSSTPTKAKAPIEGPSAATGLPKDNKFNEHMYQTHHTIPSRSPVLHDGQIEPAAFSFAHMLHPGKTHVWFSPEEFNLSMASIVLEVPRKRPIMSATPPMMSIFPTEYPHKVIGMKEKVIITGIFRNHLIGFNKNNPSTEPEKIIDFPKVDIKHGHLQFTCANKRSAMWLEVTFEELAWPNDSLPKLTCIKTLNALPYPTFSLVCPVDISFDDVKVVMESHRLNTASWIFLHANPTNEAKAPGTRFILLADNELKNEVLSSRNKVLRIQHQLMPKNIVIRYIPTEAEMNGNASHLFFVSLHHNLPFTFKHHHKLQLTALNITPNASEMKPLLSHNRASQKSFASERKQLPEQKPVMKMMARNPFMEMMARNPQTTRRWNDHRPPKIKARSLLLNTTSPEPINQQTLAPFLTSPIHEFLPKHFHPLSPILKFRSCSLLYSKNVAATLNSIKNIFKSRILFTLSTKSARTKQSPKDQSRPWWTLTHKSSQLNQIISRTSKERTESTTIAANNFIFRPHSGYLKLFPPHESPNPSSSSNSSFWNLPARIMNRQSDSLLTPTNTHIESKDNG